MPFHLAKFHLAKKLLLAALLMAGAGNAMAGDRRVASLSPVLVPHLQAVGGTSAPIGYVRFCAENKADCVAEGDLIPQVPLDAPHLSTLDQVNRSFNTSITPMTDMDHYGELERWAYPDDGKGDCEDYVLAKRRALINLGWPASVLLITVVRDKEGDGHAVLTVVTDRGDVILDNQENQILPWQETGYRYVKRQSQGDPTLWVSLGDTRSPPVVGGGR
ncbi:transglutaminase-like cysteine peptidase [Roseixanthobacter glucoisosaccharinicivorans]|uniref:transglutaminase-like cysteine peptidase n=1 Tax=Roseixanthobacter glucoisosaccharinicivorans TaxID=3119923 RepID=UPI003728F029